MTDEEQRALLDYVAKKNEETRKPRFDGTVNLGHLLTFLGMGLALVTMYSNDQVYRADHEARIRSLETSVSEFRKSVDRQSEAVNALSRVQDRLSQSLDYFTQQQNHK